MALISRNNPRVSWRKSLPWLGLGCILVSFVIAVIRLHPTNFFGYTEDDSIYFSSAKALAEGRGYVLASVPGTPAATKYPVFYPWLLSWVWRWNPSFPANLVGAIAVTVAFGLVYFTVAFLFLRRLRGINDVEALLLTAFCAFHPLVLFYSGSVLSDIPFAALALAALLLAEKAMQCEANTATIACCGILVGLAMLTRVFGVPIAAGIVLAVLMRRAWRPLLVFGGCVAPFFVALCWRAISPRLPVAPVSGAAASSLGWVHTWVYYTNYLNAWKTGVPTTAILFAMLKNNALILLRTPADYFLSSALGLDNLVGRTLLTVVTAIVVAGILREARHKGFRPIHLVLPFYAFVTLLWNYPQADRFFIPFLPLFVAGIWLEGKHILGMVRATVAGTRSAAENALAAAFGIVIFAFVSAVAVDYASGTRKFIAETSTKRHVLFQEKREAYQWLSRLTPPNARVVAYEDGSLYLYSGRPAIRPFTFTTAEFYDPPRLGEDIEHLTDVAHAVGAAYWLSADDDYGFEWPDAYAKAHARMSELERVLPLVFRSDEGHVRVYSLGCIQHPDDSPCQSAKRVLFPAGGEDSTLRAVLR